VTCHYQEDGTTAEEGKGEVRVNLCLTLTELGATGYKFQREAGAKVTGIP